MKREKKHNRTENRQGRRLEYFAPPGIGTDWEVRGFITGLVVAFVLSFDFFIRYRAAYQGLYYLRDGERVLLEGVQMMDFAELLDSSLNSFFIYCGLLLLVVVWHYLSFYQESKSIYVMKRLPSSLELHKRVWTLPLIAMVLTLAAAFVVLVLYFEFYMIVTPEQCLTAGQWQKIWR